MHVHSYCPTNNMVDARVGERREGKTQIIEFAWLHQVVR